jgi:DNA-binding response OmpR family regulator
MNEALCPCCSAPVKPTTLYVDLNTNVATRNGESVKLQPTEAVILHVLNREWPLSVSRAKLLKSVYGGRPPPASDRALLVRFSHLRNALPPLKVRVVTVSHVGWRLEFLPLANEVAA